MFQWFHNLCGPERWGPEVWGRTQKKWGPEAGWGPEGWGAQHFALFSPLPPHFCSFFFLWGSSRGILVVFEATGPSNVDVWSSRVVVRNPRGPEAAGVVRKRRSGRGLSGGGGSGGRWGERTKQNTQHTTTHNTHNNTQHTHNTHTTNNSKTRETNKKNPNY